MRDLFTPSDPLIEGYARVYDALSKLREGFHRSGRFDDSNAKLDEVFEAVRHVFGFQEWSDSTFPAANSSSLVAEFAVRVCGYGTTSTIPLA